MLNLGIGNDMCTSVLECLETFSISLVHFLAHYILRSALAHIFITIFNLLGSQHFACVGILIPFWCKYALINLKQHPVCANCCLEFHW